MRPLKFPKLLFSLMVATFLAGDIVLSLAGRDTYCLRYMPFMSLQLVATLILMVVAVYVYALSVVIRKKNLLPILFSFAGVCGFTWAGQVTFEKLRKVSESEAKVVAMAVMAGSTSYTVKFQSESVEKAFYELKSRGSELTQIYAFHPYGRYTFGFIAAAVPVIMNVDKGLDGWRVFIAEKTDQMAPPDHPN